MINTTSSARRTSTKFAPFGIQPQTTTSASARRSLIDRQKEYVGVKKSKASLSPDQLRASNGDIRSLRSSR